MFFRMKKPTPSESSGRKASDALTANAHHDAPASVTRRHLRVGWWSLLVFLSLGAVLETLHGLKIGYYLDVSHETRRLMWTLAHAHGTLLSLVHVAFALTVKHVPAWPPKSRSLASRCLTTATILLPSGFFLGGVIIHEGDPGVGIALVPVGAIFLFLSVLLTARAMRVS